MRSSKISALKLLGVMALFCVNNIMAKEALYFNKGFHDNANIKDTQLYEDGTNYINFWETCAQNLDWFKKWDTVLEWNSPYARWFSGGKINIAYNCLDRHINSGNGDKVAFYWSNERGEKRTITYSEMFLEVNRLANVLKSFDIKKGDRVAIYMPLVPESVAAMLACQRIGAIHTVIFGGIGAGAVQDRILDAEAKILLTADGSYRRGKIIPYKEVADSILPECPSIKHVLVLEHTKQPVTMQENRDHWYHEKMQHACADCPPEEMDSEDQSFILYTSGTTGKPKGIIHTTAGYLLGTHMTYKWVFDSKPEDVYWCTADIGWITGHSYLVYGPMSNAATQVIYEGSFDHPHKNVFSKIIDEYNVTIFYTAPTLIRMFMRFGDECLKDADLSSLRLLGSIGEPINPEAWHWFYEKVGHKNCPIVDTWFQTETGSFVISPLPGVTPLKPGSITQGLPGYEVAVLDEKGNNASNGYLAIKKPFPSMMRGVYKNHDRYIATYWNKWNGQYYFAGDNAQIDDDGYIWVGGRSDEVIKVAGHRIGTAEIENALMESKLIAESAVIGVRDELRGSAIIAFVVPLPKYRDLPDIEAQLKQSVAKYMGAYARPQYVVAVEQLPKNRSGKILRRIIKNSIEGKELGNTVTLLNKKSLIETTEKAQVLNRLLYNTLPDFPFQKSDFEYTLIKAIQENRETILTPMMRNTRNPECYYVLETFSPANKTQLKALSEKIQTNFAHHPVFDDVLPEIKNLYCNANSPKGLADTASVPHAYALAVKADGEYIGFVLARFNASDTQQPFLQIKRLHTFHETTNNRFFGVGKLLLNVVATIAKTGGVSRVMTTAPYPIEGYFKHLGWQGEMIYTDYKLEDKTVNLPQFKCNFNLTDDFRSF